MVGVTTKRGDFFTGKCSPRCWSICGDDVETCFFRQPNSFNYADIVASFPIPFILPISSHLLIHPSQIDSAFIHATIHSISASRSIPHPSIPYLHIHSSSLYSFCICPSLTHQNSHPPCAIPLIYPFHIYLSILFPSLIYSIGLHIYRRVWKVFVRGWWMRHCAFSLP